jgi:D-glycerate 3-kinase
MAFVHHGTLRMKSHASMQNEALAGHLLDQYAGRIARSRRPYILGLSGLQGSGKSTLARVIRTQAEARGWATEVLSLDDFYYARSDREALAHQVHPLLRSRGVPGTHEIELLLSVLAALPQASDKLPVTHPRFDKGRDTRIPPSRWPRITRPPKLVIVEGWALGIGPNCRLHSPTRSTNWNVRRMPTAAGDIGSTSSCVVTSHYGASSTR